ncbi:MAG: hypothetical protein ACE5R4_11050 [Armatimonadota bacterium]
MTAWVVSCAMLTGVLGQSDAPGDRLIGLPGGEATFELTAEGALRVGEAEYCLLLGDDRLAVEPGSWRRLSGWLPAFESEVEVVGVAYQCTALAAQGPQGPVPVVAIEARNVHLARRRASVWLSPARAPVGWALDEAVWASRADPEGTAIGWQAILERGEQAAVAFMLSDDSAGAQEWTPDRRQTANLWHEALESEGIIVTPDVAVNLLWKRASVRLLLAGAEERAEAEEQAREALERRRAAAWTLGVAGQGEMALAEAAKVAAHIKGMMVREEGEELHLLPGVVREWLAPGKLTYFAQLPTKWGRVTCFLKGKHGRGEVVMYPPTEGQPAALVLHAPEDLAIAQAVVDGEKREPEPADVVRLPPNAHMVQLTWADEGAEAGEDAPAGAGQDN